VRVSTIALQARKNEDESLYGHGFKHVRLQSGEARFVLLKSLSSTVAGDGDDRPGDGLSFGFKDNMAKEGHFGRHNVK
jgi:hypothetical protein